MNLNLRIAVYRGGDYWRECWESVKQNLDMFDGVYISFNYSELQAADIALIQEEPSEKIHWRKENKTLTAVQHCKNTERWFRKFHIEGHVFMLCHDDILLRDGLLELKKLDLQKNDAAIGGVYAFYQDASLHRRPITIHECCCRSNTPITAFMFCHLFEYRFVNVSGIVVPASIFHHKYGAWLLLHYGHWAEYCFLCNPEIKKIYQTIHPVVKIRLHQASEGANTTQKAYLYDALLQFCHIFSVFPDKTFRMEMVLRIMYTLKKHFFKGILYFIDIQFKARKLDYYYPAAWKIYWYMLIKIITKPFRIFSRG